MSATPHRDKIANKNQFQENDIFDYSDILDYYDLTYFRSQHYWQIGELENQYGWAIFLSGTAWHLADLLNKVIPLLIEQSVPFKVVQDCNIAEYQLNGSTGFSNLGKLISIYPHDDRQAAFLAKQLIVVTEPFRGPAIPNCRLLGSNVYVKYIHFTKLYDPQDQISLFLPPGVEWPFSDLKSAIEPKPEKLLNYSYYPISVLKPDAKGDVVKALYFKKPWQIKTCIIKQGRKDILVDKSGRDIRARLEWQYQLYQELKDDVPMPEIFNIFFKNDDLYLCMEYIKGISLTEWISLQFNNQHWQDLHLSIKIKLLKCLVEVVNIIHRIHKRGYLHRDISPENFLISKNTSIYLIDLELAWCSLTELPDPPFQQGTPGFISPEKYAQAKPAIPEDIFALGALIIVFFTNLAPLKFSTNVAQLEDALYFLIEDVEVAKCISCCMAPNPEERPEIATILRIITRYKEELQSNLENNPHSKPSDIPLGEIDYVIQLGISSLSFPQLLSSDNNWVSLNHQLNEKKGNEQKLVTKYYGWYTGISGPMWLLSLASRVGFDISACSLPYQESLKSIKSYLSKNSASAVPNLYNGTAGIALTISEGLNSGLLLPEQSLLDNLKQCFSSLSNKLNLSSGIAGQGIALLNCTHWLEKQFASQLFDIYLSSILDDQQHDGAWNVLSDSGKKNDILSGLDEGVAGIVWFLLLYYQKYKDPKIAQAIDKAINWFIKNSYKQNKRYYWNISTKSKSVDPFISSFGIPGIVLVMIKAYQLLQRPLYRDIAENILMAMPPKPVFPQFDLSEGLAGLGEIYLEAAQVFGSRIWEERARWVAWILLKIKTDCNEESVWLPGTANISTADLSSGISGILHFLLRFRYRDRINHFLDPNSLLR